MLGRKLSGKRLHLLEDLDAEQREDEPNLRYVSPQACN